MTLFTTMNAVSGVFSRGVDKERARCVKILVDQARHYHRDCLYCLREAKGYEDVDTVEFDRYLFSARASRSVRTRAMNTARDIKKGIKHG